MGVPNPRNALRLRRAAPARRSATFCDPARWGLSFLGSALLCVSLGACAAEPGAEASPADETPAANNPGTRTPENSLILPECPEMNPLASAEHDRFVARARDEAPPLREEITPEALDDVAGPQARAALDAALQWRGCTWPVDFHRSVTQYLIELPPDVADRLQTDLRASRYAERVVDESPVFSTTESTPGRTDATIDITYGFADGVWIAILEDGPGDYLVSALEGLASPSAP